jgi:hypothetical protein
VISVARILLFLFFLLPAAVDSSDCNPFNISLQTVAGKPQPLKPGTGHQATAFIFLLPDCPACQSYSLSLNSLDKKYKAAGIRFIWRSPRQIQHSR